MICSKCKKVSKVPMARFCDDCGGELVAEETKKKGDAIDVTFSECCPICNFLISPRKLHYKHCPGCGAKLWDDWM